jgi:hypothetical protein
MLVCYPAGKSGDYVIPNSVMNVGSSAFSGSVNLTSVVIPNSVLSIGSSVFSGCSGLSTVTIPNGVLNIGRSAFAGCTGLTSVSIPHSIINIGLYAFDGCTGLSSVVIPRNTEEIGSCAFGSCSSLKNIHSANPVPPLCSSDAFSGIGTDIPQGRATTSRAVIEKSVLYVPVGSKEAYSKATGWKEFKNIIEAENISVSDATTDNLKVSAQGDVLIIENAKQGEVLSVYNQTGQLIKTVIASNDKIEIQLPSNQIYIIKGENSAVKVSL